MKKIPGCERGALDIMTLVIALPVLLLLMAFMYDLLRLPFAKNDAKAALHDAAYGVENYLSTLSTAYTSSLTDFSTPAGNCFSGVKNVECNYSTSPRNAFIGDPNVAQAYIKAACELAAKNLSGANGSLSFASRAAGKQFALQFGIVRFRYSSPTSILSYPVATTGTQCGSTYGSLPFPTSSPGIVTVANNMKSLLESQTGVVPGAGSWPIVGSSVSIYLDSYWLIGVTEVQMSFMTGFFASANKTVESFVRPFNVPAGIMVNVGAL